MDGVLVAKECIHSKERDKEPGLLCKLDLEKAYDRVDWDFLLYMLHRTGFGVKWIRWIQECISSTKFSILINGAPHGFFLAKRGLRQGDPFSPFLFTMEALSRMVTVAREANLIEGFKSAQNALMVTQLQFVDDTIIFCDAKRDQVKNVVAILRCFEGVSGLKVNLSKSLLIGVLWIEMLLAL